MTNLVGITEVTLLQASTATHAVNLTAQPETMGGYVVIRITDHEDNDTLEVEDDTDRMAIFQRKAHGAPWMRRGNHNKGVNFLQTRANAVPTNVEVLFPNFDYTGGDWG